MAFQDAIKKFKKKQTVPGNVQMPETETNGTAKVITDTVEQFRVGSQAVGQNAEAEEKRTQRRANRRGNLRGRFQRRRSAGISDTISGIFSR